MNWQLTYLLNIYNWWYHILLWMSLQGYLRKHSRRRFNGESPWEYLDYQQGVRGEFFSSINKHEPTITVIVSLASTIFYLALIFYK